MQILRISSRDFPITIITVFKKIKEMTEDFIEELESVNKIVKQKS